MSALVDVLVPHLARDVPAPIGWEPSADVHFAHGRITPVPVTYDGWCSSAMAHRWTLRLTVAQAYAFHTGKATVHYRAEHPGHVVHRAHPRRCQGCRR